MMHEPMSLDDLSLRFVSDHLGFEYIKESSFAEMTARMSIKVRQKDPEVIHNSYIVSLPYKSLV